MSLLDDLNPAQREAVTHMEGPLLILAGPGSGKTRVITRRVAWLLEQGVRPYHILAITFTNKAAGEMRTRLVELLGPEANELWVQTFHAFGARFLRREAARAGLSPSFPIYDDADQLRLVKGILAELGADEGEALTAREMDVLHLLAQGKTNKEIAATLVISERTVKFHISSILGKLGAGNRTEAVTTAAQRGLIRLTGQD